MVRKKTERENVDANDYFHCLITPNNILDTYNTQHTLVSSYLLYTIFKKQSNINHTHQ
jgi:hypothetical protein